MPLPDEAGHLTPDALGPIKQALPRYRALLVGCGLGDDPKTYEFVRELVGELHRAVDSPPLVLDADGINAFAGLDLGDALPTHTISRPTPASLGAFSSNRPRL